MFFVQAASQPPDASRRLPVSRQQHTIISPPELVFGQSVPLRALFNQQEKVGRAATDLEVFRFDDRRYRIAALAQFGAVHSIAVVAEHHRSDNAAAVFGPHMQFFPQGHQRDLQILDDGIRFILGIESIFVRVPNRMLRAIVNFPERGGKVGPLQFGERIGDEHRLHEFFRHPHIEK